MVKKSADITQEDEEWLQDSPINFSKFVRRKLAERRLEGIRPHIKEKLYNNLENIVAKSKEIREQHKKEREELKEKYDAEIIERDHEYWVFKMDGEEWSADWIAEEVYNSDFNEAEADVKEFAEKYTTSWQEKLGEFSEYAAEETNFYVVDQDEATQTLEGRGFMNQFVLHMTYLPTDVSSITVKFESRVDLDITDLEKSVEKNRESGE